MMKRLVEAFRLRAPCLPRRIVPLVDEGLAAILNAVGVRGAGANAHEDDPSFSSEAVVHPRLEIDALLSTHIEIGNDVPRLHQRSLTTSAGPRSRGRRSGREGVSNGPLRAPGSPQASPPPRLLIPA